MATDEKGWFRFQRLYDVARSVLRTEDDVRRLVREAAEDDAADGSVWTEIQVDPSGYAAKFGGITAFTDLVLDAARDAAERAGIGMGVVIAANRTRHPLDARTLARLAGQYAGRGCASASGSRTTSGAVTPTRSRRPSRSPSAPACCSCPTAASCAVRPTWPSASTICGPTGSVTACARPRTPTSSSGWSTPGVALEVCPTSNVALGVYSTFDEVPIRTLLEAGADVALGADDPLLFGSRLAGQYAVLRAAQELTDDELATLARMSLRRSCAPDDVRDRALAGVDAWLSRPEVED